MAFSTASMAGPLAEPRGRARAHHATRDTEARAARLRARAPPPLTIAGTGATALSTASTVAPLAATRARARVHHATRDTEA